MLQVKLRLPVKVSTVGRRKVNLGPQVGGVKAFVDRHLASGR